MIARSATWSERRPSSTGVAAAAALGVVLFLGSFAALHVGVLGANQIIDTPVYQGYGDTVVDFGGVPYRDFALEYPPGALPVFIIPSLAPEDDYRLVFELLMALCGALTVVLVVAVLAAVGASLLRLTGAAVFAGIAPLALGSVVLTRFDLWPVLLTVAALAGLVTGRSRLGLGFLALAVAAKLYPLVLLPPALVFVARRRGAREAAVAAVVFAAVLAAVVVPFAILSPDGLARSFERQLGRPLQIESLGASLLLVAHQLGFYEPTVVSSHGSQNLAGALADTFAAASSALQLTAVVGVWLLFGAARRGGREALLAASAAAVAAFVALGKVVSPQFLVWLVPLVPLVAGGFGLAASGLLLVALVLTHLWFPSRYWDLVDLAGLPAGLLLARDLALIALLGVLALAIRRVGERARSW